MAYSDAITFVPQGGIIQSFKIGGEDIVLGFPSAESYKDSPFLGETIGRYANRIEDGKFDLNGKSYQLEKNNGPNALHGGEQGWGKKTFEGPTPTERNGKKAVLFTYLSKDGEEGYPGTVQMSLWYTPSVEEDEGVEKTSLEIEYEAELVGDEVEETINISGGPTIEGTKAIMGTSLHQVTNEHDIPTGEIKSFPGITANEEVTFGKSEPDPDHCFIMNNDPASIPIDTRKEPMKRLLKLYHPNTKIHFEALSTEPAFQFYAGRKLEVPAKDSMPARGSRGAFAIEASRYVNAINDPKLRHMVVLKKGQKWGSRTIYRGWKA